MLQKMQASCIISWAIVVHLATSQIPTFQDTAPIAMVDLLQAIGCWDGEFLTSSLYELDIL